MHVDVVAWLEISSTGSINNPLTLKIYIKILTQK
jgi:hypothetical protein